MPSSQTAFTTQGILLADKSEKLDSMNLLRLMAPIAATMLLPAVAYLEPMAPGMAWRLFLTRPSFAALLVGNASLAYIVNFTNFQITHYTSALTLQVMSGLLQADWPTDLLTISPLQKATFSALACCLSTIAPFSGKCFRRSALWDEPR